MPQFVPLAARVAADHAIVVLVVDVLQPHAAAEAPALAQRLFDLTIDRSDSAAHIVVIVFAGGTNQVRCRGAIGRGARLRLLQKTIGIFEVEAGEQLRAIEYREAQRRQHARRILAVLFERLADQEVLQKVHARVAHIGPDIQLRRRTQLGVVLSDQSYRIGVAIGLRVRVRLRDGFVTVRVLALNEACGFLIEIRGRPE